MPNRLFARLGLGLVVVLAETLLLVVQPTFAQVSTAPRDYPIPGGWFYTQESRVPVSEDQAPYRGYTVVDDADAAMWTEFRRFGGLEVLGYPLTRRYRYPDPETGMLHQAFQRGILQWRPETGRAELANVFEQFTEQGLDDALDKEGIPPPRPATQLPFNEEADRRMAWMTEPRLLARYLRNPVDGSFFENVEQAWQFLGLPQTFAEQPTYKRDPEIGKSGAPLYLNYIIQRYQKGGLQLFLDDSGVDPTIVPGDGKKDCVSVTAVGRLARRIGAGKVIPPGATNPIPPDPRERAYVIYFVPQFPAGSRFVQFQMDGVGFLPGEAVTIRLIPGVVIGGTDIATPITVRVDATSADGSFSTVIRGRTITYQLEIEGETSGLKLSADADATVNLASPTESQINASRSQYC